MQPKKREGRNFSGPGPVKFRKTEAKRLIRAVLDAGLTIARVECDSATGKIMIFPGKPGEVSAVAGNDLDNWLGKHNAHPTEGA